MPNLSNYKALHVDAVLTNFALAWKNGRFVAGDICPTVRVLKSSDLFPVWGLENFRRLLTLRRDGTDFRTADEDFTTDGYSTKGYGLAATVTKKQINNADGWLKPARRKVTFLKNLLALDREIRVKTLATAAASFATSHSITLSAGNEWDDYNSPDSDPEQDIMDACEQIYGATYLVADTILIPYKYARRLAKHPQIRKLREVKADRLLTRSGLPPVLFGLNVVVPSAGYVSTKKGQAAALTELWSDTAIVYRKGTPEYEDPTWLASFTWGNQEVENTYDAKKKSRFITVEEPETDEKCVSNLLAYKIGNISKA
jgi:hypothetical protein